MLSYGRGINGGTISFCHSEGLVIGGVDIHYVGGLCGPNHGTIHNCYSKVSVTGGTSNFSNYIGGLCGYNESTINNCYSIGSVNGSGFIGGLCGKNYESTISNCYWNTDTSGIDTSDGGIPKTTSQLHQQSTFTDWDFINVWDIGEGQTYPYLRTYSAADLNKDHIVNLLDLAILSEQWMYGADLAPGMTYKVGECNMEIDSSGENELRFMVTVDSNYIDFEDLINANCCIEDGIRLDMLIEGDVITITETELSEGTCRCMCNYPTAARMGPFDPGTYLVQVYQVEHTGDITSIGNVEVVISGSQ